MRDQIFRLHQGHCRFHRSDHSRIRRELMDERDGHEFCSPEWRAVNHSIDGKSERQNDDARHNNSNRRSTMLLNFFQARSGTRQLAFACRGIG